MTTDKLQAPPKSKGQCVTDNDRFTVDCFTKNSLETHGHPENSYDAKSLLEVFDIIENVSRKLSGIRRVDVWINHARVPKETT